MKKIIYILFSSFICVAPLFAQSEIDALRFSREDLDGTARAMSMGGAFGALGGDLTGVSINPAGIAVYRSSEVSGTMNWMKEESKVGDIKTNKTTFNLSNIGFVGYFPLRIDVMPLINFGFSYNRLKSFDKKISGMGNARGTLLDYIYNNYLDNLENGNIRDPEDLVWVKDKYDPFNSQPWLPTLGRNAFLLYPDQSGRNLIPLDTRGETAFNEIWTDEEGYIDNYDFTIGTTINNVLNLGLSLSVKDIYYNQYTELNEDFNDGGYTLNNWMKVSGAGVGVKLGAIYRPVNSLRIGFAWHSPTRYALTETYQAEMLENIESYLPSYVNYEEGGIHSVVSSYDYDLRTPGKIVASVATVLGGNFIASLDYELKDYGNMKFKLPSNSVKDRRWYDGDNEIISQDHKMASTVKVGMEYRFTPQFSGRLGYAWMQNPYDADFVDLGHALVAGSNTIHRIEGDTHYFTGGFGYRFNRNFYLDMAIVYKTQEDDLYPFPNYYLNDELKIDAAPFSLKNNSIRGLFTLGYRF